LAFLVCTKEGSMHGSDLESDGSKRTCRTYALRKAIPPGPMTNA
jgi:hypothetical protein